MLKNYEKTRVNMCVSNIQDKLNSIKTETDSKHQYKPYLLSKAESILHDAKILYSMFGGE